MPTYPLIPTPTDDYPSDTSTIQSNTEQDILNLLLPWLPSDLIDQVQLTQDQNQSLEKSEQEPKTTTKRSIETAILDRVALMKYLIPSLNHLPSRFTSLDASRPWLMYWILNSFSILNLGLNPRDRQLAIDTILSFQHPQGGFGGGPNQLAHLAPTFSCISTLASILVDADDQVVQQTWSRVDVRKMYDWMLSLKQSDGSFIMQTDGEVDVRGTYCALIVSTLLNFLTPDLAIGLPDFIASCQTYEGGLASASQPSFNGLDHRSIPLGEAHGGYTSCGLLSHFLLKSLSDSFPIRSLDYESCLRWLAQMQALPIEGGGFRGRTNKLVDGCYSWWCGGLFPVIEALIEEDDQIHSSERTLYPETYDRVGLQEYILLISQGQPPDPIPGGLRDKPSAVPDHYHTHYVLSGLSLAQHRYRFSSRTNIDSIVTDLEPRFLTPSFRGKDESLDRSEQRIRSIYSRAQAWNLVESDRSVVGLPQNEVIPLHPVFNIRTQAVKRTMDHFYLRPT